MTFFVWGGKKNRLIMAQRLKVELKENKKFVKKILLSQKGK
jgi:hypothetical protein